MQRSHAMPTMQLKVPQVHALVFLRCPSWQESLLHHVSRSLGVTVNRYLAVLRLRMRSCKGGVDIMNTMINDASTSMQAIGPWGFKYLAELCQVRSALSSWAGA